MWAVAVMLALVFAGVVLPTPLYEIYREEFHFSQITLTLVYAVYVVGTLGALLLFGRLSDQIGRRRAALPAIGVAVASTIVFLLAKGTALLFVARALSGLGSGIVAGTATAWIVELAGQRGPDPTLVAVTSNLSGIAAGPLMTGLLAQYGPWPLRLTYLAYLPMLVAAAIIVATAPETVRRRSKKPSLRPHIAVPPKLRASFIPPALTAFATFALLGFYSALLPTMLSGEMHERNPAAHGVVTAELPLVAAVGVPILRFVSSRVAMLLGIGLLVPSVVVLEIARATQSLAVLLGATALGGFSVALGFRGSLQVVNEIAPGDERAAVVSAYFLACYIGISIPVIGVGMLSQWASSAIAHLVFAAVLIGFAIIALATGARELRTDSPR